MKIKNVIGDNSPGDYEPKVGGDLEPTITKRSKARALELIDMNLNLIALFSLGAFFSFLSYLATTLEDIDWGI